LQNIFIKAENTDSLVTNLIPKDKALKIPIAHGEGKYFADAELSNEDDRLLFESILRKVAVLS